MRPAEHLMELDVRKRLMPTQLSQAQVEDLTRELAARLLDALGMDRLRQARYTAIPRGGHIVLGMLAYTLNLPRTVFAPPARNELLIVVDDCSISGHRFAEYLEKTRHQPVVFAHLCSARQLRDAIADQEPRVHQCIAAMDLQDLTRDLYPSDEAFAEWRSHCQQKDSRKRYLYAVVEAASFPWSEPDLNLRREPRDQPQDYWRLQPPDACLKNWGRLGLPPAQGIRRTIACNPDVAHALVGDDVLLSQRSSGKCHRYTGLEANSWRALAAYGDVDAAVTWLATRHRLEPAELRQHLEYFISTCVEAGIFQKIARLPTTG